MALHVDNAKDISAYVYQDSTGPRRAVQMNGCGVKLRVDNKDSFLDGVHDWENVLAYSEMLTVFTRNIHLRNKDEQQMKI